MHDLLAMGLRLRDLGTTRLWWDELRAVIVWASEGSAIYRARGGDAALWGVGEFLLASTVNTLRTMSWQITGDDKAPRPEPILPPGMEARAEASTTRGDVMSIEEMDRRLAPYL